MLAGQAPDNSEIPRNAWDRPSLEGVWNFSSNVPMQRPQRFGDREFITDEEVAELRARLAAADAVSDQGSVYLPCAGDRRRWRRMLLVPLH